MATQEQIVEAWFRLGNKSAVARELGISRTTVLKYIRQEGLDDKPMKAGRISYIEARKKPLPKKGMTRCYLLTSAQNNTKVFDKFFSNLLLFREALLGEDHIEDVELMVARFTYNKSSYGSPKSVKPGKCPNGGDKQDAWWDPKLTEYVCDDPEEHGDCRWELAPGLVFCAEQNISPTAARPLSGLESYTGRDSAIFPHAKLAMESVASMKNEATKFNYTTGAVTQRNYIAKKTGLKAEFHHSYSALIVEVDDTGSWWVRQLNADKSGKFYDCPDLGQKGVVLVDGTVTRGHQVEAVNWGDVHASEIDKRIEEVNWGEEGILDSLMPKYQLMHDLLSFRSRSHHEMKSFAKMYEKWLSGEESVEDELRTTSDLVKKAERSFCQMVIVSSNHDRHGERWLDEADYRKDPLNAELFLEAQLSRVRAMKARQPWDFCEWGLKKAGVPNTVRFLERDESFVLCKKYSGGIECSLHGDEGPDGARGSTLNLRKLGRRVNKGHDHKATILDGVYSAGSCQLNFGYMHGPSSHSVSHIVTYPNGKRCIVTVWGGKWRA